MKRKKILRILEILCIVSLLLTIIAIQRTYARYYEKVDTTYDTHIKKWLIKINDNDIHEHTDLSQIIQPVIEENENMNSNDTLVPGRTGYFTYEIDYSYVDVAFEYKFSIEQLNDTQLDDFEIYGYQVIDGENITTTETKEVKEVINPTTDVNSENKKKREIKVLFRWNDNEDNTMNNAADTQFRGKDNTDENDLHTLLNYKAIIDFKQYVSVDQETTN